eukprot:RCo007080
MCAVLLPREGEGRLPPLPHFPTPTLTSNHFPFQHWSFPSTRLVVVNIRLSSSFWCHSFCARLWISKNFEREAFTLIWSKIVVCVFYVMVVCLFANETISPHFRCPFLHPFWAE